ncbi:MAG: CoA transferase [Chloroflexi bacterium]|nr:CoA transferase [Chloroflexota bacterium]
MAQPGPLRGIRVLDITQMIAGPYCAMMLADAGAEVIKIERPGVGDLTRQFGPFIERDGRRVSAYFMRFARDKRSVTLNLGHPTGQELLRGLVRHADVLLENFQPGTMERFGLGWPALRELNPRLVYATISGFGHSDIYESPYWERMALDLVAQAYSGLMDLNGEPDGPPVVIPGAVGDVIPAMLTAYGVMLALWQRGATGQGQHVDVSMYDALTAVAERAVMVYGVTGEHMRRGERTLNAPYSVFRAKDGYIGIGALTQDQWRRLCAAMGRPDLLDLGRRRCAPTTIARCCGRSSRAGWPTRHRRKRRPSCWSTTCPARRSSAPATCSPARTSPRGACCWTCRTGWAGRSSWSGGR